MSSCNCSSSLPFLFLFPFPIPFPALTCPSLHPRSPNPAGRRSKPSIAQHSTAQHQSTNARKSLQAFLGPSTPTQHYVVLFCLTSSTIPAHEYTRTNAPFDPASPFDDPRFHAANLILQASRFRPQPRKPANLRSGTGTATKAEALPDRSIALDDFHHPSTASPPVDLRAAFSSSQSRRLPTRNAGFLLHTQEAVPPIAVLISH